MAKQQPIIGITTTDIVDDNYGIPVNYHTIERIEIAERYNHVTVTFAGYFSEHAADAGKQPFTHNAVSFTDFAISDDQTMQQIRDALYERAIAPLEQDADTFSGGEIVRAAE